MINKIKAEIERTLKHEEETGDEYVGSDVYKQCLKWAEELEDELQMKMLAYHETENVTYMLNIINKAFHGGGR